MCVCVCVVGARKSTRTTSRSVTISLNNKMKCAMKRKRTCVRVAWVITVSVKTVMVLGYISEEWARGVLRPGEGWQYINDGRWEWDGTLGPQRKYLNRDLGS